MPTGNVKQMGIAAEIIDAMQQPSDRGAEEARKAGYLPVREIHAAMDTETRPCLKTVRDKLCVAHKAGRLERVRVVTGGHLEQWYRKAKG